MRVTRIILPVALALGVTAAVFWRSSSHGGAANRSHKVIILGIDGLDPQLLRQFMNGGKLPHFASLAGKGSFLPLGTSTPPQSPVAWSNVITGTDPGGHGIFDFIHRDPQTMTPYFSTSQVEPPKRTLTLGNWIIPLASGRTTLLRKGKAFWEYLDERGIPAVVFRIPSNFPPVATEARTFAGMGTPDLVGSYGTFSFYTDEPLFSPGPVNGGRIYSVQPQDNRISAQLYGPYNTLRKDSPQLTVPFTVLLDPAEPVAKLAVQDQELILREGEWSGWVRVQFTVIPLLESVSGICRFYLKQVRPQFELYVSPLNIDPSDPALPLSTPEKYSRELTDTVGLFHTQGIAEDTKALSSGLLSDAEFLQQADTVWTEQRRIFRHELDRFRGGFLFFYFSTLDQLAHMFWRTLDAKHPGHTAELGADFGRVLEEHYRQMDQVVGLVLERLDEGTTLLIVSDHGFAPFYRSFNLNNWLLENGYLVLRPGVARQGAELFRDVEWSRTRAYGLGLNGLYLNLRGRERDGIVAPGAEADALRREVVARLMAVRDAGGAQVISRVDEAGRAYAGPFASRAPDLIVGYNRGYRVGWASVLGGFSGEVLEDNLEPWSGDHCTDFTQVPGVFLSNRKAQSAAASLVDVAPTILQEYGIPKPAHMQGHPLFLPAP